MTFFQFYKSKFSIQQRMFNLQGIEMTFEKVHFCFKNIKFFKNIDKNYHSVFEST